MFELLEARQLLAVTAVFRNDGVLVVTGTPGRDHIEVSISNDISPGDTSVIVKGQGAIVEGPGMPTGVIINGGGGADNLSIGQSMAAFAPVTIQGGDGDDVIGMGAYGGYPARIYGGRGNDQITINDFYGGGKILVHGGAGDDVIERASNPTWFTDELYHPSPAHLYGGAGHDRITSGDGNDHLFGGAGNDTLKGGLGDDLLVGGSGKDRLSGGAGNNTLRQD
jgi:Ca2+-binding RTX toxin-like protein